MAQFDQPFVDWTVYQRARAELGAGFIRILGYFREDGIKSVGQIEQAMRAHNAAALVLPAHTLKGEAQQFGALRLAATAEHIEMVARDCVELHHGPDELIEDVVALRPLFLQTMTQLDAEANPVATRGPAFGRKVDAATPRPGFRRS